MSTIDHAPKRRRANLARGLAAGKDEAVIVRDGGDYGAGLIRGVAVITRGEALTHDFWIDRVFLAQTAEGIGASKQGIKARFTHPGLSSDGTGKFLGRIQDGRVDGDVVRGDLHLSKTAHHSPDGDLAAYVMDLAEEDPEAFGTSIVFDSDFGAEDKFASEHEDKDGRFISPDEDNEKNYPHARLAKLYADDIVDDPAANPDGLFGRGQEIPREADALLSYAIGLTQTAPVLSELSVDPDRTRGFVARFLDTHGLCLVQKSKPSQEEDSTMELAKLTLDELRAGRPDLIESLAKEAEVARLKAVDEAKAASVTEERSRCSTIVCEAGKFQLPELAGSLITEGLSADAALGKLKDAKIAKLTAEAPESPGPNADPNATEETEPAADEVEAKALKQWKQDASLRAEFGNDKGAWLAFERARNEGKVKILKK